MVRLPRYSSVKRGCFLGGQIRDVVVGQRGCIFCIGLPSIIDCLSIDGTTGVSSPAVLAVTGVSVRCASWSWQISVCIVSQHGYRRYGRRQIIGGTCFSLFLDVSCLRLFPRDKSMHNFLPKLLQRSSKLSANFLLDYFLTRRQLPSVNLRQTFLASCYLLIKFLNCDL